MAVKVGITGPVGSIKAEALRKIIDMLQKDGLEVHRYPNVLMVYCPQFDTRLKNSPFPLGAVEIICGRIVHR